MSLVEFQLLHPGWLIMLPFCWLLVWLLWRFGDRDSMWQRICDPHLLRRMQGPDEESMRRPGGYWLVAILLSLGVVAAAGPSWSQQVQTRTEPVSARVMVLELSRAMLVEDARPDRFSMAVQMARDILDTDFNGETGLVVFAGAAFVVSPLSRDANALRAFLDALDPSTMPLDGSRIDLALHSAADLLEASPSGRGQILVIGSVVDHPEASLQSAIAVAEQGHSISVMAIGNAEGGPLKLAGGGLVRDEQGSFVISKPDFTVLQGIADIGGGHFIRTADSVLRTELLINELGADTVSREHDRDHDDRRLAANDGYWLVWLMLPFCLLLFRRNQFWILLVVFIMPLTHEAEARELETFWQHRELLAYDAFNGEDYTRVLELSRDPGLRGSAQYRLGRYEEALVEFADDGSVTTQFNRGNTLVQLQRYAEAILAFDEALKLDPAHAGAIYNKRLLEFYIEQQRQGETAGEDGDGNNTGDSDSESESSEARIGMIGERLENPGEDSESGSGLGVSIDPGQADLSENYDGSEQQLERFAFREGADNPRQDQIIDAWIETLPQASSDLYRRKFLRDYQRQNRQER